MGQADGWYKKRARGSLIQRRDPAMKAKVVTRIPTAKVPPNTSKAAMSAQSFTIIKRRVTPRVFNQTESLEIAIEAAKSSRSS